MNFQPDDPEWLALWGVALASVFVVCLPMLLAMLGLTRVSKTAEPGADYPIPCGAEEKHAFLVGQLTALGFEPLGVKRTAVHFFGHHWVKRFTVHTFGSRRHGCYASVYELAPGDGLRVSLSTVFADGSMVTTGNSMVRLRIAEEDYFRWGLATEDMTRLLNGHVDMIAQSAWAGQKPAALNLDYYVERDAFFEQRHLNTRFTDLAPQSLSIALTCIGVFAVPAAVALGWEHWLVPLAVAAGAVSFKAMQPGLRSAASRGLRREDGSGRGPDDNNLLPPAGGQRRQDGVTRSQYKPVVGRRDG